MVGGDAELMQEVLVIFDSLRQNTLGIRNPGAACGTLTYHGLWVTNEAHCQIRISSFRPELHRAPILPKNVATQEE